MNPSHTHSLTTLTFRQLSTQKNMAVLPVTLPFAADERAPNVSVAMRRRITAALEARERPALRSKNLRLGSVILQRADGRDAPCAK